MFNEIPYRQILKTAMGIKVTQIYDDLVVGCHELKHYERTQKFMRMNSTIT